jgi:hypothetical protein
VSPACRLWGGSGSALSWSLHAGRLADLGAMPSFSLDSKFTFSIAAKRGRRGGRKYQ